MTQGCAVWGGRKADMDLEGFLWVHASMKAKPKCLLEFTAQEPA